MHITLKRAAEKDAPCYWAMQREAFLPLLMRYQDHLQSPANETCAHVAERLAKKTSDHYLICLDDTPVGAMSVYRKPMGRCRLNRLFILPAFQGRGIAYRAMRQMEAAYPDAESWELDTIAQERGNCHLYEKLGYRWTGHMTFVNPRMTLVDYVKHIAPPDGGQSKSVENPR